MRSLEEMVLASVDIAPLGSVSEADRRKQMEEILSMDARWLNRFRCPTSKLNALRTWVEEQPPAQKLCLCAVAEDEGLSWEDGRSRDAVALNDFLGVDEELAELQGYSVPLSAGATQFELDSLQGFSSVEIEVQLRPDGSYTEDMVALIAEREFLTIGLSGCERDLKWSARQIVECCGLEVPFRCLDLPGELLTAGSKLGVLNALAASLLAFAEDLGESSVEKILHHRLPSDWRFTPVALELVGFKASLAEIIDSRSVVLGVSSLSQSFAGDLTQWSEGR